MSRFAQLRQETGDLRRRAQRLPDEGLQRICQLLLNGLEQELDSLEVRTSNLQALVDDLTAEEDADSGQE